MGRKGVALFNRRPTWIYTVRVFSEDRVGVTVERPNEYHGVRVSKMYDRAEIPKWIWEATAMLDVARDSSGIASVPGFGTATGITYVLYPPEREGEANETKT